MGYDGAHLLWEKKNLRSANSVIGQVVYEPGGTCGPRIQKDYELIIMHSGACLFKTDAEKNDFKLDTVSFLPPGQREFFSFSKTSETHHSWCTITPSAMPEHFKTLLKKRILNVPCTDTFKQLLTTAFQVRQPLSPHGELLVDILAQSLFAEFLNMASDKTTSSKQTDIIAKAIRYMDNHYSESDCLAKSHIAAGASRSTLINRFKKEMKTTPDKFLWKIRTERGIAMLVETGLTAAEIAYQCGFKTPFHFSRMTTLHNGASPRTLSNLAWSIGKKRS
jgi:AraC-like DNA-binding protein